MVLQRTIENLRERPSEERRAVAFGIALAVMLALFLGWAVFFFRSLEGEAQIQQVGAAYNDAVQSAQSAYDQTGWVSEASTAASTSEPSDNSEIEMMLENETAVQ